MSLFWSAQFHSVFYFVVDLAYLYYTRKKKKFVLGRSIFFYKFFYYKFSIFRGKNSIYSLDGCSLKWLLLTFIFYKTPLGETGCLSIDWFIYFFECLGIQFFNSLTCDLRDAMPRHWSLTLLPKEAEDFPWGDRRFKHVPPLTCLICLSPKEFYMLGLSMRYGYLAMKYNVSYKIWTLFTIS